METDPLAEIVGVLTHHARSPLHIIFVTITLAGLALKAGDRINAHNRGEGQAHHCGPAWCGFFGGNPKASFVDDLGADSLDQVELIMAFEESFDMEIPDDDAGKISTVQDAINYIQTHAKSVKQ